MFMGLISFMGIITQSSRNQSPHRMVFFTFHYSLFTPRIARSCKSYGSTIRTGL